MRLNLIKKTTIIFSLATAIFLNLNLLNTLPVYSQEMEGMSMYPFETEIRAKQGDTVTGSFILKNNHTTPFGFELSYGEIYGEEIRELSDEESFLHASVREFVVLPNEEQIIYFDFLIPANLNDGFYVPLIILKNIGLGEGTTLKAAIGHRINLFVSGNQSYESEVDLYKYEYIDENKYDSSVDITFGFKNVGDFPSKILTRLQVIDNRGNVYLQKVVNENLRYLSPDKSIDETFKYDFDILDTLLSRSKQVELQLTDTFTGKSQVFRMDLVTENKSLYIIMGGTVSVIVLWGLSKFLKRKLQRKDKSYTI
jgi:hypothetical protein